MIPPNLVKIHQQLAMLEWSQDFHIFGCVFRNIIAGATSITHILDLALPHDPTKFRKDPSTISELRVVTRFSHFGLCIT